MKDKNGTSFSTSDPSKFLSQRAIDRRLRYHLPVDESDLPLVPAYLDSIRLAGDVQILNTSKWLNQVCIKTTDTTALNRIRRFSFVVNSAPVAARIQSPELVNKFTEIPVNGLSPIAARPLGPTDVYNYGNAYAQINLHSAEFLHNLGFRGEGMQMAIMDAGFFHYKTLPTFDSLRLNNQVLGTWDFVANEESVDEDYQHGMACLSTIAANLPGVFVGTSPKCSFYLFRTEDVSSESPVEEQNWIAAAERADSAGVDLFSVSLGYDLFDNAAFNYTYADMDGNTTPMARAADLAAKKGILMVVSAGNEGTSSWKYITTPADADSVLTVGAVNASRQVAAFSSYGPSADGRIKPDVVAMGQNAAIAQPATGLPIYGSGTSYASPIMAGIVSCLWQAFPEVNNMTVIDAVRQSSDHSATPDDRSGYGVPDAKKAFVLLLKSLYRQQVNIQDTCKVNISLTVKTGLDMTITIERKLASESSYQSVKAFRDNGNFSIHDLSYLDNVSGIPTGTAIQYRLKMDIGTDTSFYLDSATVLHDQDCSSVTITEGIRVSPNPVSDQVLVQVTHNNPVKTMILIHSALGQLMYSSTQTVSGVQTIPIPMKRWSGGVYILSVWMDDKRMLVKKLVRQ